MRLPASIRALPPLARQLAGLIAVVVLAALAFAATGCGAAPRTEEEHRAQTALLQEVGAVAASCALSLGAESGADKVGASATVESAADWAALGVCLLGGGYAAIRLAWPRPVDPADYERVPEAPTSQPGQ